MTASPLCKRDSDTRWKYQAVIERCRIPMLPPGPSSTLIRLSVRRGSTALTQMAARGEPSLLIADEPTTALDVATQAQTLLLIKELQVRSGMGPFVHHPRLRCGRDLVRPSNGPSIPNAQSATDSTPCTKRLLRPRMAMTPRVIRPTIECSKQADRREYAYEYAGGSRSTRAGRAPPLTGDESHALPT